MYLLMGNERAVLLDTGATEEEEFFPLRETVDKYATMVERPKCGNA